jgi:hypothetical protein
MIRRRRLQKGAIWLTFSACAFLLFSSMTFPPPQMPEPSNYLSLRGTLSLWQRPECLQPDCKPKETMGIFWEAGFLLTPPESPERPGTTTQAFHNGPWTVHLNFSWARKRPQHDKPFQDSVVTRIRISHQQAGLISECSRYDQAHEVTPFPVGDCSGKWGNTQFGVSLTKPPSAAERTLPRPVRSALPHP